VICIACPSSNDLDVAFDLHEAVTREGGKRILRASASGV
jgi:hypothetical protein